MKKIYNIVAIWVISYFLKSKHKVLKPLRCNCEHRILSFMLLTQTYICLETERIASLTEYLTSKSRQIIFAIPFLQPLLMLLLNIKVLQEMPLLEPEQRATLLGLQ